MNIKLNFTAHRVKVWFFKLIFTYGIVNRSLADGGRKRLTSKNNLHNFTFASQVIRFAKICNNIDGVKVRILF